MKQKRKLTAKQESYKNNRVEGMNRTEALLASTYSTSNMSQGAIYAEAAKLDAHPLISLEIEKAKEEARTASILTREEALQILTTNARDTGLPASDQHQAIKQFVNMEGWDAPKKTALTDADGKSVPLSINVNAPEVAEALAGLMDKL